MIVWTGRGWVVALLSFALFLATELTTEAISGDSSYYQQHGWTKLAPFLLSAAITFALLALGVFREERRTLVDEQTGAEVKLRRRHTLFFIPMRYWPWILVALGIVFFFVRDR